jgi:hypothetical protein
MSEWRPIETAPRDGSWVLVHDRFEDNPCVASWDGSQWIADKTFVKALGGRGGAMVIDEIDSHYLTHWHPLPAPPEDT